MGIPERVVEEMVKEASIKMSEPGYAERMVQTWITAQPHATQYLASRQAKLGGAEGVINAVFHAALLAACFKRHSGRSVPLIGFPDLDRVSQLDQDKELAKRQPPMHAYLVTNVENVDARKALILIALGMDHVF